MERLSDSPLVGRRADLGAISNTSGTPDLLNIRAESFFLRDRPAF